MSNEPQKAPPSHRDYVEPRHAARILRCHVSTVYRLCLTGKIPARKRGNKLLILRADVDRYDRGEPVVPPPAIEWPPREGPDGPAGRPGLI